MIDLDALRLRALALMRETLALLDAAGEQDAALHQRRAHDALARVAPVRRDDDAPAEAPDPPELDSDPALVRAIGNAFAVFATLMQRGGPVPLDEMARILGIYAVVTSESSPQEGLLLGCWAAILRDAAQVGGDTPHS